MRYIAGMGVERVNMVWRAIMAGIVPPEKWGEISSLNGIAGPR